jgi:two-component system response regulator AtoC
MARVLLVDDEPAVLFTLEEVLHERGHETVSVRAGAEALERLEGADVVISDFAMPGMDGLALLAAIRAREPHLPVVLLTARGSERLAVQAMRAGAHDYLTKPFDVDEVALVVERAAETAELRRQARRGAAERAVGRPLVGDSAAFRQVVDTVLRLADREVSVLLRGETGTGKELLAVMLHAQSRRARGPFVRFNCAAIPAELAEAELFGHARGAFTGAHAGRPGFFAQADHGTLVLDEVGELPLGLQAKLLRAVQEGEIQPVGAGRVERVDVRIVACTNRDLRAEAAAGRFREDLYFRLAVVEVEVPPLRARRADIPALAESFCRRFAARFGLEGARLSPALLDRLAAQDWPGNVRELENTVARLLALSAGGEIGAEAFQLPAAAAAPAAPAPGVEAPLREQVSAFERELVARTLAAAAGNQSEAARRLGLSRATLIDKLKRHGLA